jgi:glycogen phosphorylase
LRLASPRYPLVRRTELESAAPNYFSRHEPGVFSALDDTLLAHGDRNMHLADLKSYLEADQRLLDLYSDQNAWARKAILNVASSWKFSTDRTIAEYAAAIWNVTPCPVP